MSVTGQRRSTPVGVGECRNTSFSDNQGQVSGQPTGGSRCVDWPVIGQWPKEASVRVAVCIGGIRKAIHFLKTHLRRRRQRPGHDRRDVAHHYQGRRDGHAKRRQGNVEARTVPAFR